MLPQLIKSVKSEPEGRIVYIIRHGQTKLNAEDKIRAWIDVPLDETGVEQAHELGEAMRKQEIELDGLLVSDLQRSVHTALIVSEETGIPVLGTTKSLRPWDAGELSGHDGPTVHKVMTKLVYNNPDEQLGNTGESFNTFKFRILGGIISMLNANRGLKIGFVSHSRGERILHAWVAAGCPSDLDIDLEVFLERGEGTATAQELIVNCPLVLT